MLRNNVPSQVTLDNLGWKQNILDDGEYYIQVLTDSKVSYLTNNSSSRKVELASKNDASLKRQQWQISHDGEGYKITSAYDGRYLNEKQEFGTNAYDAAWNTFIIYTTADNHSAIQTSGRGVGGRTDASFWSKGETSLVLFTSTPSTDAAIFSFLPVAEVDGIKDVTMVHNTSREYYALDGIRLTVPKRPGVYVCNGRKVVVR